MTKTSINEYLTLDQLRVMEQRERVAQMYGVDHFVVQHWYDDAQKKSVSWGDFVNLLLYHPDAQTKADEFKREQASAAGVRNGK